MFGKTQVKLLLFTTALSLVISCLVTNCPRGGKRGSTEFYLPTYDITSSGLKKCKLCTPHERKCIDVYCSRKILCGDEPYCIVREVCCSKWPSEYRKSCGWDIYLTKIQKFQSKFSNIN